MTHRIALYLVVAFATTLTGCVSGVNPFVDRLQISPGSIESPTASAIHVREVTPATPVPRRSGDHKVVTLGDGSVTHYPLYFEDPFEYKDDGDGEFSVTGRDFALYLYGPARWVANGIAVPVSAVSDPPWARECSDGFVGGAYDARRCRYGVSPVSKLIDYDDGNGSDDGDGSDVYSLRNRSMTNPQPAPVGATSTETIQTIPVEEKD
jgi:hypothetical protein